MQLKSLRIKRRESWETQLGFTGTLEVESPTGEIKINLTDEACRTILAVAGAGIQDAAKETADFLRQEALDLTVERLT